MPKEREAPSVNVRQVQPTIGLPVPVTRASLAEYAGFHVPSTQEILANTGGALIGAGAETFLITRLFPEARWVTALGGLALGGMFAAASTVGTFVEAFGLGMATSSLTWIILAVSGQAQAYQGQVIGQQYYPYPPYPYPPQPPQTSAAARSCG